MHQLTAVPARMHGLAGRGELSPGSAADLCVIDPDRLRLGTPELLHDLPGGAPRLHQPGEGYRAVFVNGKTVILDDAPTGAAPGKMLHPTENA